MGFKAILIFILFLSQNKIFSRETDFLVISLGIRCLPAAQIERYGLRSGAYPFDWNDTGFGSLVLVLQDDFRDFFAKENIKEQPYPHLCTDGRIVTSTRVIESKYNIALMHDFSSFSNIVREYEDVKQKYERRINRFYEVLLSGKHIYFIRHLITKKQAIQLTELLDRKFPSLNYTLVAIDYTDEIKVDWNIPKIKNFYFGRPTDDWPTLVADREKIWDRMFKSLGLI